MVLEDKQIGFVGLGEVRGIQKTEPDRRGENGLTS